MNDVYEYELWLGTHRNSEDGMLVPLLCRRESGQFIVPDPEWLEPLTSSQDGDAHKLCLVSMSLTLEHALNTGSTETRIAWADILDRKLLAHWSLDVQWVEDAMCAQYAERPEIAPTKH